MKRVITAVSIWYRLNQASWFCKPRQKAAWSHFWGMAEKFDDDDLMNMRWRCGWLKGLLFWIIETPPPSPPPPVLQSLSLEFSLSGGCHCQGPEIGNIYYLENFWAERKNIRANILWLTNTFAHLFLDFLAHVEKIFFFICRGRLDFCRIIKIKNQ